MGIQADKIFINLPVKDLNKSVEFFTKIGFEFDAKFTNEKATCMILGENMFVMLLVEEFFKSFTKREIPNTTTSTEVIVAFSVDSKELVNELVSKALAAGGTVSNEVTDQSFMYSGSFHDLDGHLWELFYMDQSAIPQE